MRSFRVQFHNKDDLSLILPAYACNLLLLDCMLCKLELSYHPKGVLLQFYHHLRFVHMSKRIADQPPASSLDFSDLKLHFVVFKLPPKFHIERTHPSYIPVHSYSNLLRILNLYGKNRSEEYHWHLYH